mgnify:CR=1 FL=1
MLRLLLLLATAKSDEPPQDDYDQYAAGLIKFLNPDFEAKPKKDSSMLVVPNLKDITFSDATKDSKVSQDSEIERTATELKELIDK